MILATMCFLVMFLTLVAWWALYAYRRISYQNDLAREQHSKWRNRYSQAFQREMLPKKRLHEFICKRISPAQAEAFNAIKADPCNVARIMLGTKDRRIRELEHQHEIDAQANVSMNKMIGERDAIIGRYQEGEQLLAEYIALREARPKSSRAIKANLEREDEIMSRFKVMLSTPEYQEHNVGPALAAAAEGDQWAKCADCDSKCVEYLEVHKG